MEIRPSFEASLARSMRSISPQKVPLYNFIYGAVTNTSAAPSSVWLGKLLQDGIDTLSEYPRSLIAWPTDNSHRLDLPPDWDELHPAGNNRSSVAIPRHQSDALRWCNSPYVYEQSGDGLREEDPTFWHLAYWLGRAHRFIPA